MLTRSEKAGWPLLFFSAVHGKFIESESAVDAHFDEKLITYRPRDGKLTLYRLVLANLFREG